jgi:hypothetical protein
MAIRFNGSTDLLSRASLVASPFTAMGWGKITTDRNNNSTFFAVGEASGAGYYAARTASDGTTLEFYNEDEFPQSALTVGTWYHLAITLAGTGVGQFLGYRDGALVGTNDGNAGNTGTFTLKIGNSNTSSSFLNGCMAAVKVYSAVLTAAEIAQEMRQYMPLRTANLVAFYPLLNTGEHTVDFSGNANDLTAGAGALDTEDGPPIPWRRGITRSYVTVDAAGGTPVPVFYYHLQQQAIA